MREARLAWKAYWAELEKVAARGEPWVKSNRLDELFELAEKLMNEALLL